MIKSKDDQSADQARHCATGDVADVVNTDEDPRDHDEERRGQETESGTFHAMAKEGRCDREACSRVIGRK